MVSYINLGGILIYLLGMREGDWREIIWWGLGELSHSVIWLDNLEVCTMQLTDMALGGTVEIARR